MPDINREARSAAVIDFHVEADEEMVAASQHYEDAQEGLGISFLQEVDQGLDYIARYPQGCPIIEGNVRRYLLKRFPYGLLYRATGERIQILAVMHSRQEPGYWLRRRRR